jgi:hypothetical protein
MKRRRCLWPSCPNPASQLVYCYQHYPALGLELQTRLRAAHGTTDWLPAIEACQSHAKETIEWARNKVTGGSDANSHTQAR